MADKKRKNRKRKNIKRKLIVGDSGNYGSLEAFKRKKKKFEKSLKTQKREKSVKFSKIKPKEKVSLTNVDMYEYDAPLRHRKGVLEIEFEIIGKDKEGNTHTADVYGRAKSSFIASGYEELKFECLKNALIQTIIYDITLIKIINQKFFYWVKRKK